MAAWWLKPCDDHWEVHAFRGNSRHKGCETRVSPGHEREHEGRVQGEGRDTDKGNICGAFLPP